MVLLKSVSNEIPSKLSLHCAKVDLMQLLWSNTQLDYQLLRYMVAGMRATEGQLRLSIAFDKANVGGPHSRQQCGGSHERRRLRGRASGFGVQHSGGRV